MAARPHELLRLLTRAERLSVRRVQSVLDEFDCSIEAWRVLDLLSDGRGHNMSAIADGVFLPMSSLTKIVDQLVDQNLVYRRIDPADRRRVLAQLTPRGLQRRQQMNRQICAVLVDLGHLLTQDGGEQLHTLLARLADALDDPDAAVTTGRTERTVGQER
ncbi:MarR family transcriptional regulator [Streptomyces sp. PSKA54]|uniref:MarR family transcriptional regulator n=1 Tax=Streptomyces himalayensis subsp. aureolus TaxID=2758039 RepID=A0A7W2HEN5_9ACTN|nr:MarR family transcriptional regulator [Streptomyces himalayensis]MBA4861030.1 MarR family transcriptional regulator [Streptomyces himalayensis subsp. aureolus]